jgi:hypothetical protein
MQTPAQADWQQTPSTHSPEWHWRLPVQGTPSGAFFRFWPDASGSNSDGSLFTECGGAQPTPVVNAAISSAIKQPIRTPNPQARCIAAALCHSSILFQQVSFQVEKMRCTGTRRPTNTEKLER